MQENYKNFEATGKSDNPLFPVAMLSLALPLSGDTPASR